MSNQMMTWEEWMESKGINPHIPQQYNELDLESSYEAGQSSAKAYFEGILKEQSERIAFLDTLVKLDMRMRCGDEVDPATYKDIMSKAFDEGMMKLISDGKENYAIGM